MAKKTICVYIEDPERVKIKKAFISWARKQGGIRQDGTPFNQNDFICEAIAEKIAKCASEV